MESSSCYDSAVDGFPGYAACRQGHGDQTNMLSLAERRMERVSVVEV